MGGWSSQFEYVLGRCFFKVIVMLPKRTLIKESRSRFLARKVSGAGATGLEFRGQSVGCMILGYEHLSIEPARDTRWVCALHVPQTLNFQGLPLNLNPPDP